MNQFNKPNLQNLQQYMEKSKDGGSNIKWWRLPAGTSIIRILPPWDATGMIALPVYSHRITYQEPGSTYTKYSWNCVHRTFDKPCNICKGLEEIRNTGVSTEEWDANSRAFYANALVVNDANWGKLQDALAPNTHVLINLPKTVYDWIVSQITNPQIGDITDIQTGIDIFVTRSGAGLETRYSATLSPNGRQPIDPAVLEKLELYNITEIFSTGFEDARVEGLINSLKSAAAQLGSTMPQMSGQMYQPQAPQMPQQMNPQYMYPQSQVPQVPQYNPPVVPQNYQAPAQAMPQVPPNGYSPAPQIQIPPNNLAGNPGVVPPPAPQVTQQTQMQIPPQAPANIPNNVPRCFGVNYNNADVNCITCPYEVDCSQKASK